jgi:hypothetical protein
LESSKRDIISSKNVANKISLVYAEIYVTLGNLFRCFGNMKGNALTEKDRSVNDYISSGVPLTATRFQVTAVEEVA